MIGMSQQKKAIIKQRLTSSVSIFLISPYFTTKTVPRAAMPTTTIDQPMISHLKKSDKQCPYLTMDYGRRTMNHELNSELLTFFTYPEIILPHQGLEIGTKHAHLLSRPCDVPVMPLKGTEDKGLFNILHRFFPDLFL